MDKVDGKIDKIDGKVDIIEGEIGKMAIQVASMKQLLKDVSSSLRGRNPLHSNNQ
jgi:hypothetical protein